MKKIFHVSLPCKLYKFLILTIIPISTFTTIRNPFNFNSNIDCQYLLIGTGRKNSKTFAMIKIDNENKIVFEGDKVGDFIITKIEKEKLVLK